VGLARCVAVLPVSVVVGAAVPAAVCVSLGALPTLSWRGEVSLGGGQHITIIIIWIESHRALTRRTHAVRLQSLHPVSCPVCGRLYARAREMKYDMAGDMGISCA